MCKWWYYTIALKFLFWLMVLYTHMNWVIHLQVCSAILHGVSADYFVLIFIILLIVKALLNFIVISLSFIIAQSFMSL
ncbi:hypothetical protein BY996DRAFT_7843830, partial [Phakopsora pachyrhizi]